MCARQPQRTPPDEFSGSPHLRIIKRRGRCYTYRMEEICSPPFFTHSLLDASSWEDEIPWKPFRKGVEIHRLYGDGLEGPSAAFLRFAPGGSIPSHSHTGYEHIIILRGSQLDEEGLAAEGTLRVHAPGTRHSVVSKAGCIALAIYEKPVSFLSVACAEERLSPTRTGQE